MIKNNIKKASTNQTKEGMMVRGGKRKSHSLYYFRPIYLKKVPKL